MNWWEKFWCYNFGWLCKYVERTICLDSGKLANEQCPRTEKRQFLEGEEPTQHCELPHTPPPPPYAICKYPYPKIKFMNGWGTGYENLVMGYNGETFTYPLWDKMANEMAKNHVNGTRHFGYCTENQQYIKHSYQPFYQLASGLWDCGRMNPEYERIVGKRLESYHKRKITTIICLLSSIKGKRFNHCPLNGNNNINETSTDHADLLNDETSRGVIRKYAMLFGKLATS